MTAVMVEVDPKRLTQISCDVAGQAWVAPKLRIQYDPSRIMLDLLRWESAGNDGHNDQHADTDLVPHGHWSLGDDGESWTVELIVKDDELQDLAYRYRAEFVGPYAEERAKEHAARFESRPWQLDGYDPDRELCSHLAWYFPSHDDAVRAMPDFRQQMGEVA